MGKVYKVLSFVWRNTVLKGYREAKKYKERKYWEEHIEHLGKENKDKYFYIIRRQDAYCGLCSIYITAISQIRECIKKGYVPIIDMQNNFNIYLDQTQVGKENAWEYYFEQPLGYSLSDISKSQNVIWGSVFGNYVLPYMDIDFLLGKTGEIDYWRNCASKYMKIKAEIVEQAQKEWERLFSKNDKVLGVRCRGTDYVMERPKWHAVQPNIDQVLEQISRIMKEQHCTKIYLMTEDEKYYQAIENEWGNSVVTYREDDFIKYSSGSVGKASYEQTNNCRESGKHYLIQTMLLSKCHCLCAGRVSATAVALLMTTGYEYVYLFDLGIYGE